MKANPYDNLRLAERWGWILSAQTWLSLRALRNQMVHEYIKDPMVLSDALNKAHEHVPDLSHAAHQMVAQIQKRFPR